MGSPTRGSATTMTEAAVINSALGRFQTQSTSWGDLVVLLQDHSMTGQNPQHAG
jgi:hypothetical protein